MIAPISDHQPWVVGAACRGCVSVDFFPDPADAGDDAKAVCMGCAVRQPCLDHALSYRELGIWGGTTELERYQMRPDAQQGGRRRLGQGRPGPPLRPAMQRASGG